ncbi:MAG: hypothetical protein EZS28_007281 [Streblomastix strix]|uniref:Uncharacterized protein n=1 Tax=Streblomastix strix TaxID=222440 RepID=A0A5J4WQZ0_9EUKA|nr:MAG: hypothetical protein EZS28_007281 [Streblomastix strix]
MSSSWSYWNNSESTFNINQKVENKQFIETQQENQENQKMYQNCVLCVPSENIEDEIDETVVEYFGDDYDYEVEEEADD